MDALWSKRDQVTRDVWDIYSMITVYKHQVYVDGVVFTVRSVDKFGAMELHSEDLEFILEAYPTTCRIIHNMFEYTFGHFERLSRDSISFAEEIISIISIIAKQLAISTVVN